MRDIRAFSSKYLDELKSSVGEVDPQMLESVAAVLWSALEEQRTVYVFGNGGSAATASHLATDLGKGTLGLQGNLPSRGFKVISLNDNISLLTAWANDTGYERVFAEQLRRLLTPGDVVIAISASGNSPNIIAAIDRAIRGGAITIGLTGFDGGHLATLCDYSLVVDSFNYGIVEDVHLCLIHILTQFLRDRLYQVTLVTEEAQEFIVADVQ